MFLLYRAGAFMGADGKLLVQPGELPNCNMRLYGGAQFHRAMAEFRVGVGQMACPSVTRVRRSAGAQLLVVLSCVVTPCSSRQKSWAFSGYQGCWTNNATYAFCPPAARHLQHESGCRCYPASLPLVSCVT